MNRAKKAKAKKLKRALLITANLRGYKHATECYRPYSGATNGKRTHEMLAYESGFDHGLRDFYLNTRKEM
tara:strand:- start:207 stop:416 length:210 start_codon:yes stop_codon:yes gene_type:complete